MASSATDRIPPFFILAPVAGIAAWLLIGKVGLGLLAIPVLAALLCNVTAAVHHAEVVALRVGEPFGGLILALSVTVIEAGLIISLMLTGDENPALMRDTLLATVMFVLHGIAGLAILVGGIVHRENQFRVAGANAMLAVLMPMAVLVLIVPNHVVSAPGPYYSNGQLAFVSLVCLVLYAAFLFIQTNRHREFFLQRKAWGGGRACAPKRALGAAFLPAVMRGVGFGRDARQKSGTGAGGIRRGIGRTGGLGRRDCRSHCIDAGIRCGAACGGP